MDEIDELVNESGRIDDPWFQIWSDNYQKETDRNIDQWFDEIEVENG